jgi:acyl-CoA thioester hydrolase
MWISEMRTSRFTVSYELFDGDELACRAASVCVPFDLATQRPRRLSDAERAFLTPWAE